MAILARLSGIRLVWAGLSGLYGTKFTNPFGANPDGATGALWQAALGDLSDEQLRHGLSKVVTAGDTFCPAAPEFRALCLDVLELAEVRADLSRTNEERHPFTRLVWSCLDVWAYTNGDDFRARDALASAYALARKARMDGAPLPEGGQYALPKGRSEADKGKADPSKMTWKGQQIIDAFARELHPRHPRHQQQGESNAESPESP